MLKYTILRAGSKVGVPQTGAPPCCQELPAHVAGLVVQKRHRASPSPGCRRPNDRAPRNRRPKRQQHFRHCSRTGADELRSKGHASAVAREVDAVFQTTAPVFAFRATKFASSRASKTNPLPYATPRLSLLQQTGSVEIFGMSVGLYARFACRSWGSTQIHRRRR